ncbi:zinc finger FYVE domain-containing protein 26 [Pristis pectinata]|uniref:zinc finger FYVE domain-containing protein 26 n=1 Tax=Pristis pectinata TaxID=685728 RepID=UPI00223DE22D|nr:zinc finger FYVE domain-containing protein 26 [Pristis pectinata]XP_051866119.1 zinc finger FYVE domain-containing protein 26 [Pristis pectinata]XP_051866129.1 zinc finger FYVE domain-containing protein 26 [Pristis pectinata]
MEESSLNLPTGMRTAEMYPFGREEEDSFERLFMFFREHLRQGHWALAQACMPQLRQWKGGGAEEVKEIIQAIVACPYKLLWESVSSPHRLAWLWLLELELWWSHDQISLPPHVRSEIEFFLLLELLQPQVSQDVIKELHDIFLNCHNPDLVTDLKKMDYSTHKLSSEAFSSLFNLLSRSPQLVQAVVSFLLVENSNSSAVEYNHTLQKLFVDFLHYALCSLKKARQGEAKNGSDMDMHERTTNQIYSIISVLTFDVERRTFEIRQLCEELYNACCATEYGLNEDRLLGCMLGKQNQSLISLYSAVSIEKSKEKLVAHISPERVSFELSEAERVTLALFTDSEEHSVWKELYFYSTSNSKHFLEQILVTALQCIKREDYSTLSRVLKKTFKPFTRLLVLLGWTYCQSLESAQTLLYTLHENKDLCCDAVLHNFCTGLSSHIEVLEWCLKQNRNSIPEKNFIRHLYSLDCHSALYSLHHFTNLPALKAEDIIDLLQKQSANDKGARCLSMTQRRNVTLYQALCAIKYAIYALCINAHQPSSCKDCPYLALDAAVKDVAAENDQSRSQDCSAVFKFYLSRCQEFLHVIPAPFRLEVLENIFSLLFLSYNDLNGDKAGLEGQFCLEEEGDTEQIQALKGFGCTDGHLESTVGSVDYNVPHREHTNTGLEENATLKSSGVLHDDCMHKLKKIDFMSKFAENDSTTKELDYLDLKHFMMSASRGNDFLVNPVTMNIFLELIKGHLEAMKCHVPWTSGNVSEEDVLLVECLNCSIGADSFGSRLAQLSRYICEAQWRYKVVTSNNTAEGVLLSFTRKPPSLSKHSTLKRRNKAQRNRNEQSSSSQLTVESVSGDLSTSTSDGGVVNLTATNEQGLKAQVPRRNLLLPMMLAPPESLLISCILRGNFAQAHQVALMFEMQSSYCYSELIFMERYQEVINELVKVEQKMENQGMDNANRKLSVGRFTLQAIGDAAAAGMVFYSISDVIEKLINSPEVANSALSESFWKSNVQIEPTNPLHDILEYLSAPAMAVFDLACTQCQLWKTCKQLLETAERRLMAVFEAKGRKPDSAAHQPDGIQGFPSVLQQMSKILNFSHSSHGSTKIKPSEDRVTRHLSCSLTDLLLACYPELSEECVTTQLNLSESLEQITQKLQTAIKSTEAKTNILSWLEQTSSRSQDSEGHTIRSQMKQLLKNLDRQIEAVMDNQIRPDYVRSLFDYINTLAAVLVRSMNRDTDQFADIKVGNPFIVLQQTPSQLFAQLLFEKPTSPDRLFMLLHKEELNLNVQEIIVSCCCERLPLWNTRKLSHCPFFLNEVTKLIEENTKGCLPDLGFTLPSSLHLAEEIVESELSESSLGPYSLIPSALNFLKSRSKLLAVLVCLTATRGHRALKHNLSWKERLSSRTEAPLDMEQICKECEELMKEFPILEHFLSVMAEPFPRTQEETASLVDSLYGNPCTTLLLSGLHSEMAVNTVIEVLRQFLSDRHWLRALKILELYGDENEEFEKLKDVLLGCAVMEEKEGWEYLIRIRNATLRAKLVLHCIEKWPLDACLEVLFYCLSDPNTNKRELKSDLLAKKKELQVYQKILNLEPPIPWHGWQELRTESNENPQTVMDIILKSREFELCESWVRLHPVPMNFTVKLQHEYLLHLLELGEGEKAFQLLRGICDPDMCQVICEQALDQHPGLAACHFLSNYLTTHFHKSLSAARCHEIQAMRIGSKLLLTLPESAHDAYSHLSSNPLLMLEQLLMNMKVDWASVAVQTLHQLLMGQEAGFAIEDIDCLLSKYAAKALEVPYAVREKTRSDSVINLQDLLTQSAGPQSIAILPNIEQTTSLPSVNPPLHGPSTAQGSIRRSKSITEFVPPDSPPAKKDWVPDSKAMFCLVCCKERFTMFNRRHHCRRCGRVVCQSCSTNKMVVKDCRENPVRVCDQCYNYYHTKEKEQLDEGEDATSCAEAGTEFAAALQMPRVAETHWNLTLNEDENETERSEFSYEQAPSASLCIAILNLHSNSMVCGHQLIDHCSKLSQALTNPEVDACLLMDIMKQLLFSAKMMFVKAGRSQDLALCDSYISKVDVVKILVAANYQDVPSLEQILKPAAITRLRNKLLETEYYALAVEVSTKSGLDPGGVWQAWGLACLKVGNLSGAREKFSRCLKPPFDRNQLNPGSSLLQEIVQHLETSVKPVFSTQGDDILVSLRELEAMLKVDGVASEIKGDGKIKQQVFYEECLFYLQSYGTNLALISFYMRHNCTREALQHLLNKDCPEEVFIQGIFIPSYATGRLHALENLMEELDPSLERWSHHLIASCKHLQMRGFFNILYDLQCFMKDHMRAAMTCIRFFSHKAESYSALGAEQSWLVEAKGHLKTYLQEVSNRSSSRKKNTSSFRKKMSAADVSRYINTIELQIEVTKFLHRCEISGNSRISGPPANLFGNNKMKMEVACKVLLGGKNIEEGFGISFRVIQDFQLDAAAVYDKAAKHLLQQHKVSQIRQLLKCVSESGVASGDDTDNLLIRFIEGGDEQLSQSKELEKLILEMKKDDNKIKAFLLSNKYRSAYLVAVKLDTVQAVHSVQEVLEAAERAQEELIPKICRDWLKSHQPKMLTQKTHGN